MCKYIENHWSPVALPLAMPLECRVNAMLKWYMEANNVAISIILGVFYDPRECNKSHVLYYLGLYWHTTLNSHLKPRFSHRICTLS